MLRLLALVLSVSSLALVARGSLYQHWTFDDNVGNVTFDSVSAQEAFWPMKSVYGPGVFGEAAFFTCHYERLESDGTNLIERDNLLRLPSNENNIYPANEFTISLWIKPLLLPDELFAGEVFGKQTYLLDIDGQDGGSTRSGGINLYFQGDAKIQARVYVDAVGGHAVVESDAPIQANVWTFITVVRRFGAADASLELYINGQPAASPFTHPKIPIHYTGCPVPCTPKYDDDSVNLGGLMRKFTFNEVNSWTSRGIAGDIEQTNAINAFACFFGLIDELKIWDSAVSTAAIISENSAGQNSVAPPPCQATSATMSSWCQYRS